MAMDIQDMVAAMAAKNEAFRGNEMVPEKVEVYNKLKEHAAAISKAMRTPWHADDLELREQNTFVYVDFPLPVSILNYVEQLLQRPVFTHELATEDVQKEIKEKARPAFLMLCQED